MVYTETVERWGVFELSQDGKSCGNPFLDCEISGEFSCPDETVTVSGFYDGDGVYKLRFMPRFEGEYSFSVYGSFSDSGVSGSFTVTPPKGNNHGPVMVKNEYGFEYADGTPCIPLGTTCYAWAFQSDELIEKTLDSLKNSPFTKLRFCVFPKHYSFNLAEPRSYPYKGTPMDSSVLNESNFWSYNEDSEGNEWDFYRFNTAHFSLLEKLIIRLCELGIEADVILFHPYDRWGFSKMTREQDELYLKYVSARFGAFRNVWWSMANEYDFMRHKQADDWKALIRVLYDNDMYNHMLSIHNGIRLYDFSAPEITHCSIQRQDLYKTTELTDELIEKYHKPVVWDEIAYEGNIPFGWGNITAEELVRRFWEAALRGGFGGHGETYLSPDGVIWWSHGGTLKGKSPKRIAFLRKILEEAPSGGLKKKDYDWDCLCAVPADDKIAEKTGYHLFYFGFMRPAYRDFHIDDDNLYEAELIDTWNMRVTRVGAFKGWFRIDLPVRQFMAVRIKRLKR